MSNLSVTKTKITIMVDNEVFQRIEQMRGTRTQFRSGYVNTALREKMGLPVS